MALWLALCLPALPLQLAMRALAAVPAAGPLAVTEGPGERPWVSFCNEAARAAGIAPAMKLAAAQALARTLTAVPRRPDRERDALHELACWGYQFSAQVTIRQPTLLDSHGWQSTGASCSGLVLETGGSEQLFGGRSQLHRRIVRELGELGYRATSGYAPTARAAWLIGAARAGGARAHDATAAESLHAALACLPLGTLDWDRDTLQTLRALGLATLGDLLALPRDALARRFGADRLEELDRALGTAPDPQPAFTPPAHFDAGIELPADMTQAGQLIFPAHRLLRSLEGFLRGLNAGATALAFTAHHSPRAAPTPTRITLALAAPERDAGRLAQLLAERLARARLPAPAIRLTLAVEQLAPFQALNASLLPPSHDRIQDALGWLQLAETLHARLGSERVFQLQSVDDHRPEHAYRITPVAVDRNAARATGPLPAAPQRPLRILPAPQPLPQHDARPSYGGPLALLAGPERIEAGWWDCGDPHRPGVHRDYFVARNRRGQTLWVYRELAQPCGWYLHGFFS